MTVTLYNMHPSNIVRQGRRSDAHLEASEARRTSSALADCLTGYIMELLQTGKLPEEVTVR